MEQRWNYLPVREKKPFKFLYKDDTGYTFMDTTTYEQISVASGAGGRPNFKGWTGSFCFNEQRDQMLAMGVELPDKIVFS